MKEIEGILDKVGKIVSGAAPPPFRIFAGVRNELLHSEREIQRGVLDERREFPRAALRKRGSRCPWRRNAPCPVVSYALLLGFELIQEYCEYT